MVQKIDINRPCKVIESKLKRYAGHYEIPVTDYLVVPLKRYGDQLSCDVLWKDAEGNLQTRNGLMFDGANLEVINAMKDYKAHELWEKHQESLVQTS